ncbi:MAG: HD domain-containing protein [Anaerolineae bacterium]|nr:HD domain-containing protein [Thermoflexales bacterium]MDW8407698.1 HD domain-containing protein [Anaerolineae bacterium]
MSFPLQHSVLDEVRALSAAHHTPIVLVGGAVRDWLLGVPVADLDFAVQGNAVALARAVADRLGGYFYVLDAERGTGRVILKEHPAAHPPARAGGRSAPFTLDFSVCRGDSWEQDLLDRDFTVNAIAIDLQEAKLIDPTGGQSDLHRRIIRYVQPAAIDNDPVRALRAVRLSLSLAATIDPDTADAIRRAAGQLHRPSPERVRDELMRILERPDAARGVRLLDGFGLLKAVVPEVEAMRTCYPTPPHCFNVLEHTLVVLDCLDVLLAGRSEPNWFFDIDAPRRAQLAAHFAQSITDERSRVAVFRLATLLHDSGKPAACALNEQANPSFDNHPTIGAELAVGRARALKLSNDEVQHIQTIVRHHARPNFMSRHGETDLRAQYRLWRVVGDCLPELALLCVADGIGKAGNHIVLEERSFDERRRRGQMAILLLDAYYTRFAPDVAPLPLISGQDVLALGVRRGPRVGQIIESVREAQLAGEIATPAEALALARELAGCSPSPAPDHMDEQPGLRVSRD